MKKQKVTPLTFDTYLAVIKNSIGSKLFRNFYAMVDGRKTDIMKNGELSCAFYVSSILTLFKFTKEVHATVDSTVKDLEECGWKIVKKPKPGSILVWEKGADFDNHKHIGFYVGEGGAVSTSYKRGFPAEHDWVLAKRKVELILWSKRLKQL